MFQYDLQNIVDDEAFFREKRWHTFASCLDKLMLELHEKYGAQKDTWKAIRAYNGSGASATEYANNVIQFATYSAQVTLD